MRESQGCCSSQWQHDEAATHLSHIKYGKPELLLKYEVVRCASLHQVCKSTAERETLITT